MGRSGRKGNGQSQLRIDWGSPRLLVLVGIPGSGKSTWAQQMQKDHGCRVISSDEIRLELFGDLQSAQTPRHHQEVFRLVHRRLLEALRNGEVAVCDATNLYPRARRPLYELAREAGVPAEIVFFGDHDLAKERNALRKGGERVPDEPMERMQKAVEKMDLGQEAPVHIF